MYQSKVHLIGYLGKDVEQKSVKASDRKYAVLSLATRQSWKGADHVPETAAVAEHAGEAPF
jgi:hypothetical protein